MSSNTQPVIGYLLKCYPRLSETFILNEILELERQGIKLHIFSLRQPDSDKFHADVAKVKAEVTYIPFLSPNFTFKKAKSILKAHWQIFWQSPQRYLKTLQFHLSRTEKKRWKEFWQAGFLACELQKLGLVFFQTHFANVPTAVAELVHRFSNIPYSIFAHAKDIYLTEPEVLDRRIASANFVLTCTGFNHRYLQSISTSTTPIHLSYHGLDFSKFSINNDSDNSSEFKNDVPLILSVGRFCEKKGFPYLIQACHLLKQKGYQFRCQIVGYGELQREMEQAIKQLKLKDVITIVGKLTQDKLIELYRQTDMFVLPCQIGENGDRDGIPNVLLEAMAMKIPVISTAISGITELIADHQTGLLVEQKDSQALADAIEELINNPQLREKLQQAGRTKVIQQFSLEENIKEIKTLLMDNWQELVVSHQSPTNSCSTLVFHPDRV